MKTPRFAHRKKQGEWAELAFMARAAALGFNVLRPHGDCMPFDVVLECRGRFLRIQVKSVSRRHRANYYVNCGHIGGNKVAYSRREIDFLAVLVIPEEAWYIIPIVAINRRKGIRVCPLGASQTREFERFREAWPLLRPQRRALSCRT